MVHSIDTQSVLEKKQVALDVLDYMRESASFYKMYCESYSTWTLDKKFDLVDDLMGERLPRDYCPICAISYYGVVIGTCSCGIPLVKPAEIVNIYAGVEVTADLIIATAHENFSMVQPYFGLPALDTDDVRSETTSDDLSKDKENTSDSLFEVVKLDSEEYVIEKKVDLIFEELVIVNPAPDGIYKVALTDEIGSFMVVKCNEASGEIIGDVELSYIEGNGCGLECGPAAIIMENSRIIQPPVYTDAKSEFYNPLLSRYYTSSLTGCLLSVFNYIRWLDECPFVTRAEIKEPLGYTVRYCYFGKKYCYYSDDVMSSYERARVFCKHVADRENLKLDIVTFNKDRFKVAYFIYTMKCIMESINLEGFITPATCGNPLRDNMMVKSFLLLCDNADPGFMASLNNMMFMCNSMEEIYYKMTLEVINGKRKGWNKLFSYVGSLYYDCNYIELLLHVRFKEAYSCECFGFLGRDYKWNSLAIRSDKAHLSYQRFITWHNSMKCGEYRVNVGDLVNGRCYERNVKAHSIYEMYLSLSWIFEIPILKSYYTFKKEYYKGNSVGKIISYNVFGKSSKMLSRYESV